MSEYHELTKHPQAGTRPKPVGFTPLDPSNRPAPFKRYPGREPAPFPTDLEPGSMAHTLFYAAGVTRRTGDVFFRTAMSAGNLHPLELYVLDDTGVHHFAPDAFGLTPLHDGTYRPTIVVTGIPWRTAWKYGERGYRHLYWDAGTMLANLLAVRDDAIVHVDFDDDAIATVVGVDGVTEFPLAVVTLGHDELPEAPQPAPAVIEAAPLSRQPITFTLITQTQRAGIGEHSGTAPLRGHRVDDVERVILRRGSTRLFARDPVALDLLTSALADSDGDVIEHFVAVHAVDGLTPGTYVWRDNTLHLQRPGDLREVTQALCLHQPLGGDAAFTVFHCADLRSANPRAYRAAQLQAGVASGRAALAAFAAGAGATGLTFFDDQVSAFFRTELSCMLVTAVGVPAYRNKPGGTPGQPVELTGYDRVMVRLAARLDQSR